jgi:nucleoside-diphosphate-sugar epimerase
MVYVGNLVDFLILCAQPERSPLAANETFLISDGQDVSSTDLLKTLAQAQGKPARLIPIPATWLGFALKCLGKSNLAQRLLGDLQIDSSKARTLLGCDFSLSHRSQWRRAWLLVWGMIPKMIRLRGLNHDSSSF